MQFEDFPFRNHLELLFQCVGQKGQRCREENDACSFISYAFLRLLILDRKLNMNLCKRFAIAVEQRTGKSALAAASFKALIIYTVLLCVAFYGLRKKNGDYKINVPLVKTCCLR